jgi:hypothetical protein
LNGTQYTPAGLSILDGCVCISLHECTTVADETANNKEQEKEENETEVKGGKVELKTKLNVVLFLFHRHISPGNHFSFLLYEGGYTRCSKKMHPTEVTNTENVQNNYHYFTISWFHNSDFLIQPLQLIFFAEDGTPFSVHLQREV